MGRLDGKVAFVTGAAVGNGEGIARALAREGAQVILADVSDKVFDTVNSIQEKGHKAWGVLMNVTSKSEIKAGVSESLKKFGKIDILVNNAGISKSCNFLEVTDELRDLHIDVNIKGAWNCTQAIIPNMIKQKYGKIINISSVTGPIVADPKMTAYALTKAAIHGFTKALAIEFVSYNITVNSIMPGYILTPNVQRHSQDLLDAVAAGVPMQRLGTIEEIGNLAAYLASDESSYITGTSIIIDGGSTLPETMVLGR
ncbi:MAG TPA: glucose 1-dehydrogenase [Clostridiales bacterium]|jgi:NAD(P)-dependent dehydrogenase (short-subunit alcohol dehydrogenase family)|nr:glucose 1-dehydrogenase [Clostridiales bacterium]